MYNDANLIDEVPTLVLKLLRETFGGDFKAYYDGDPDLITRSNLPAICVVQMSDTNDLGPTGVDVVNTVLQIKVILDKEQDWKTTSDRQDLTDLKIRRIVSARDKATRVYLPNTVKGALRREHSLDGAVLDQTMNFELNTLPRNDGVTREGWLTVSFEQYVPVERRT